MRVQNHGCASSNGCPALACHLDCPTMKCSRINASTSRVGARALWLALACTLALPVPASAQWKWRDKGGHTQYSDLPPPPGVAEQDILQRPAASTATRRSRPDTAVPPSAASAPPLTAVRAPDAELEARRRKAEQEVADKLKADEARLAAAKVANCGRAKEQARTLESGQRLARINEKGEREYLDEAQRSAQINQAREVIDADCK